MVILVLFGTIGYMLIQGWDPLTSLYTTVLTISTVGFTEVVQLTTWGRIFTMALIIGGLGVVAFSFSALTQWVVEGQLRRLLGRRKLDSHIAKLKDHYLICGFGRCGAQVCDELSESNVPFVVIEKREDLITRMEQIGYLYVQGDATDEGVLLKAGIEAAAGIVTTVSSDADNVFIILAARELNPNITIVARAIEEGSETRILRAGANRVISPYKITGRRIANAIVRPAVIELVEMTVMDPKMDITMEQILVKKDSPIEGKTLEQSRIRQEYGLIVIGIKKSAGGMVFNPSHQEVMEAGDLLIAMGSRAEMERMQDCVCKL